MEPIRVLPCEPSQACSLEWLPLAVRFKLDAVGLKIRLAEWQVLGRDERLALLACPAGEGFEALLLWFLPHARRIPSSGRSYRDYLLAKLPAEARLTVA
jgi:hypothetical protein